MGQGRHTMERQPIFSILIPSLRPNNLEQCVESIKKNTEVDYKILVDTEPGGTYKAVDRMFRKAKGKYIVHIPDDCSPQKDWLFHMFNLMERHDNEIFEGAFRTYNEHENPHGDYLYFNKKFAAFICIRKDVAEKLGGLIDLRYNCFYGDPDLSMRVWEAGGIVEHAEESRIYYLDRLDDVKAYNLNEYEKKDQDTFIHRWTPVFGQYTGCIRKSKNV